jgi:lysophospholipase L1-like esterase
LGTAPASRAPLTFRKKLLFMSIVMAVCLLLVEIVLRIYFAILVGPDMLLYGITAGRQELFAPTVKVPEGHDVKEDLTVGAYSKYHPHQTRTDVDVDTGEMFDVAINGQGFRGGEWEIEKTPGVTRVVTLGSSSTFGYHSPDDRTYPFLLEQRLRERCPSKNYEVINLGVPHLVAHQIHALFTAEGLRLEPDVVTFYEGVNDSAGTALWRERAKKLAFFRDAYRKVRDSIVLVAFVDRFFAQKETYTAAAVERHISGRSDEFLQYVEQIRAACAERGIPFIVVTQQAKSKLIEREEIRGVSYAEEVEIVRATLEAEGEVPRGGRNFLTHDVLMRDLRAWAADNDVIVSDVIAGLDRRRDVLVSWVHLSPEGNGLIADVLVESVLEATCGDDG